MPLEMQQFVFDCPKSTLPRCQKLPTLKMVGNRYVLGKSADNMLGLTLVFAHCIGSHKEQWEPVIERAFLIQEVKSVEYRIREAWAFDWQNHGDSAILNQDIIEQHRPDGISIYEWSDAILAFVKLPHMNGHRLVMLGHSAGAATMILTTRGYSTPSIPYESIILIEPTMVSTEIFEEHFDARTSILEFTIGVVLIRRDSWKNREEAFDWLKKRKPWSLWDERVLRLLVNYGLKITASGSAALKCDRNQEAVSYPDVDGHFEATTELTRICHALPVHLIWGNSNDLAPDYFQDSLGDISQGRILASVARVRDAGHMVPQEKPELLASSVCDALDMIHPIPSAVRSRM